MAYITDASMATTAKPAIIVSSRADEQGHVLYKVKPMSSRRSKTDAAVDWDSQEFLENSLGIYPYCSSLRDLAPFIHNIIGWHFDIIRHIPNHVERQAEFYRVLMVYMLGGPDRICCSRNFRDAEAQAGGFSLELFCLDENGCVASTAAVVTFDYNVATGSIHIGAAS